MRQADQRTESEDLREGLKAYAQMQAELQLSLAMNFRSLWQRPLQEMYDFPVLAVPNMAAASQEAGAEGADNNRDRDKDDNNNNNNDDEEHTVDVGDDADHNIYM